MRSALRYGVPVAAIFAAWVLLKPERINQYGVSIIQAARNHPEGIGAVAERIDRAAGDADAEPGDG